jgi:hypothetical protein
MSITAIFTKSSFGNRPDALYNSRHQEGKIGLSWGLSTSGTLGDKRKGCRRMNIMPIFGTHVYKWKNEICLNYFSNGEG